MLLNFHVLTFILKYTETEFVDSGKSLALSSTQLLVELKLNKMSEANTLIWDESESNENHDEISEVMEALNSTEAD